MDNKKTLAVVGLVVSLLCLLPLCCLGFILFGGVLNLTSQTYVWGNDDTGALIFFSLITFCMGLFAVGAGGSSLYYLIKEKK